MIRPLRPAVPLRSSGCPTTLLHALQTEETGDMLKMVDMLEMVDIVNPSTVCNVRSESVEGMTGNPDSTVFWPYGATCVIIVSYLVWNYPFTYRHAEGFVN